MKTIKVHLGDRSYPIYTEKNLLMKIPSILSKKNIGQKWVIISQYRLMELFGFELMSLLKENEFNIDFITLPMGETAKSLNEYSRVISQMIELGCDRSSIILALGGGVVGDVSGFVATSFMRGIKYYQVPTTLLAMVDSSIGGKTGINTSEGKNLIGSIYQPQGVLVDPAILNFLSREEVNAGLGEVIKYGAIRDSKFFNDISEWLDDIESFPFEKAIYRACEIKAEIVSLDEQECGMRRLLNFGHTIGHALEANLGYGKIRHGEAVSLGMKCAGWISEQLNFISKTENQFLAQTIDKLTLPSTSKIDFDSILSYVRKDKKVRNGVLHFIVLDALGKGNVCDKVSYDLIKQSLKILL